MPRANRYIVSDQIYHVTHRCHNRSFLFKFAKDRDGYRSMLRDRLGRFPVSCLGYCITSNHTHLLLKVEGIAEQVLGRFMQTLEGDFAQYYNIRKRRKGAFWSDRYHAVMIDSGEYLWRCLRYIDLNMVRAGVVSSPSEWAWCGYQELSGLRNRYRVIDRKSLADALAPGRAWPQIAEHYVETVQGLLRSERLLREACWTESLAVGGEGFVQRIGARIANRMKVETVQDKGVWLVREAPSAYSSFSASKNGSKG
jgi:putative transposase